MNKIQTSNKTLAYLASEYPAISHTFIFREVQELRKSGLDIKTASIRRPEMLIKMTDEEKIDAENTLYIKNRTKINILLDHLKLLIKSPSGYYSMLTNTCQFSRKGHFGLLKTIGYFIEAGILANWALNHSVDHIHVHFANPAATVAMIAACYGTLTFSLSIHGPDIFYNIDNNLIVDKITRASKVRCISHFCKSQLIKIVPYNFWNKFFIIRCGVDISKFTPAQPCNNKVPNILCVGRLVPAKGQHILIEACAFLKKRGINFILTFIGDGPDRVSLESLARDLNVNDSTTFTGALGQDLVKIYYDNADMFVLPSFAEGVPVVLMEAMAKEIPCITTRITGIPELINDNEDGLLVAPSDSVTLADKIELLLKDRQLQEKIGTNARKKVSTMYDLEKNCKQMAEFFSNIF
ncbi:MAG: glycosyltransferase family 4 protein [Desulfatiglans sp.]|nr:glycosyltransferase family 4 protein [Desulfatiglans sp.]